MKKPIKILIIFITFICLLTTFCLHLYTIKKDKEYKKIVKDNVQYAVDKITEIIKANYPDYDQIGYKFTAQNKNGLNGCFSSLGAVQ